MIAKTDSNQTFEYKDYYKILPSIFDWKLDPERVKDGKIVNKDFYYSSDTNTDWMSSNQLKNWVNKNLDIFK